MRSILMRTTFTVAALLVFAGSASAAPILWTLTGVIFGDGGTASGSFVYDANLNIYSSVSVTTTAGSARTGASYSFVSDGLAPSATQVLFDTLAAGNHTGTPGFALFFPALTNAGGTLALTVGQEASCGDAACSFPAAPNRLVTSGSINGAPVTTPEPASMLLLGAGLSACGIARFRRRT
jgi:hypothetical protein